MVDGVGHNGSDRSGDHADEGVINGHPVSWTARRTHETWSSAGAALEPEFEPLTHWTTPPDRRGIEALAGADDPDDSLTSTLVQPRFTPFSASMSQEDPFADELAQRSAEFARHAAFDDPTPPQGLPYLGAPPSEAWSPPPLPEAAPAPEHADPPLAAQLSLGQRFGIAFPETSLEATPVSTPPAPEQFRFPQPPRLLRDSEPEHDLASGIAGEEPDDLLPQRIPSEPDVPEHDQITAGGPLEDKVQLDRIASHLRRDDVPAERPDGFDVQAVLEAVRAVAGVREATLRRTAAGAHHLRLELAEGADSATISRMVARMLQDQMGINAALTGDSAGPMIPGQAEPAAGHPPVVLPGPRTGLGAAPPPAVEDPPSLLERGMGPASPPQRGGNPERGNSPRDTRRRHPVSVPKRPASDLRPSERAAATWKSAAETDMGPGSVPPAIHTDRDQGPRALIDHVQTSTFGLDATVEVRLTTGDRQSSGVASGPAVDAYVLRLSAAATAAAIDDLLSAGTSTGETGRCFVEHAAIVPMGSCDVAVVVVLLVCGGWVEQLAGSALVSGDPRRAVVRATLSAVNRRLAALLP